MGSLNAFANGPPHHDDQEDGPPPAKRVRLAEDAIASISHLSANVDTSLEVDHMILDYVAYHTIEACLSSRGQDTESDFTGLLSSTLSMSDSFLAIFKAKHPDFQPDSQMRFRILLLKFATLFTQRLTANPATLSKNELLDMRETNSKRAQLWEEDSHHLTLAKSRTEAFDQELPISDADLDRNRAQVLHQLDVPPEEGLYEDAHYGMSGCVSLLDLIPTFMQLSATQCAMGYSKLTDTWMQLAVGLMLQACLEQYLVYGAQGSGALTEAFAWGYKGDDENLDSTETAVNEMFEDQDYEREVDGWETLRTSYLKLLLPSTPAHNPSNGTTQVNGDHDPAPTGHLAAHLEAVAWQHPIAQLETDMLTFLSALARSIPAPVLVQLDRGCLDGMTKDQTDDFLADCGTDVATFFLGPAGFKRLSC